MNMTELLKEANQKSYNDRWAMMIELGKASAQFQEISELLDQLLMSNVHYERTLAWLALHGSLDADQITEALANIDDQDSGMILSLAAQYSSAESLIAILPNLSRRTMISLAKSLAKQQRYSVNEDLFARSSASIQKEILAYTTATFIQCCIKNFDFNELSPHILVRLAKHHPKLTLDICLQQLNISKQLSWSMMQSLNGVLTVFAQSSPDLGLSLLGAMMPKKNLSSESLMKYFRKFPNEIAVLMLSNNNTTGLFASISALQKLNADNLIALFQRGMIWNLEQHFAKLNRSVQKKLYEVLGNAWRDEGLLSAQYIAGLSKDDRIAEALKCMNAPQYQHSFQYRAEYLAFFPWEDSLEYADAYLHHFDGEMRALAVEPLVLTALYDSNNLAVVLDFCADRHHEQDPVRQVMMRGLSQMPAEHWHAEHLPQLANIIQASLNARDVSDATLMHSNQILTKLLPIHSNFAVEWLAKVLERSSNFYGWDLAHHLNSDNAQNFADKLSPLFAQWRNENKADKVVNIIRSFGKYAKNIAIFEDYLVKIAHEHRDRNPIIGLRALMDLKFLCIHSQIPELLAKDPSWIQYNFVADYINQHRQDLLAPYLVKNNEGILPYFYGGFHRWSQENQALYAESLLADNPLSSFARLAKMRSLDYTMLKDLASLTNENVFIRDKAIECIGQMQQRKSLDFLLTALNDDRAKAALIGIRHILLSMPIQQSLDIILNIQTKKLSILKEMIRLLGDFKHDSAFVALANYQDLANKEPSIQIALLRAYWNYLDQAKAWQAFNDAALSDDLSIAQSIINVPHIGLNDEGQMRLNHLFSLLLQNNQPEVLFAALQRLSVYSLGHFSAELFAKVNGILQESEEMIAIAMNVLLNNDVADFAEAISATIRTQMNSRSLESMVLALHRNISAVNIPIWEKIVENICDGLLDRRFQVNLALLLAYRILPSDKIGQIVDAMQKQNALHYGAVERAVSITYELVDRCELDAINRLEAEWQSSDSSMKRRLGLALLTAKAKKYGWHLEYKEQLQRYKVDEDLWIAESAGLISYD